MTPGVSILGMLATRKENLRPVDSHLGFEFLHDVQESVVHIGFIYKLNLRKLASKQTKQPHRIETRSPVFDPGGHCSK
jgi:hypothetical protein